MTKISIYLAASFMIVTAVIGVAVGYYLTPQYSLAMYDKSSMDLGRPDKWLDLRYINGMIAHHEAAMLVAKQAEKSERAEVKDLAKSILENEPVAIAELYTWKKDWYGDTRKVVAPVVPNLGEYDDKFDLRFLNTVIAHHENGILMTRDAKLKSSRNEILNNATGVEDFLKGGIKMLSEWRKAWYNI
jgi:uncharacterized protein (DUF305 family)